MASGFFSCIKDTLLYVYDKNKETIELMKDVDNEVNNIRSTLQKIEQVLDSAPDKIRDGDENDKYVDFDYEFQDVRDERHTEILRQEQEAEDPLNFISCCFLFFDSLVRGLGSRYSISLRLKKLNENFILMHKETANFNSGSSASGEQFISTSSDAGLMIFGRNKDEKHLIDKLCLSLTNDELFVSIIKVVGLGGIGKTALCKSVFNSKEITSQFPNRKVWVCVREKFDGVKIVKRILDGFGGEYKDGASLEHYIDLLTKCIKDPSNARFLIVLDDIWELKEEEWDLIKKCLMHGCHESNSSKILMTTRFDHIANAMGDNDKFPIDILSDEDCWSVISHIALQGKADSDIAKFRVLGMKIAEKCKGLPLAANMLGNYLKSRPTLVEWQAVATTELSKLEIADDIFTSFSLGSKKLPQKVRRCFSYFSIFPKGTEIQAKTMIWMWMAHGYIRSNDTDQLEIDGLMPFRTLGLELLKEDLQDPDKITSWKMPTLMDDYSQYLSSKECCILTGPGNVESSGKARHIYVKCDGASLQTNLKELQKTKKARSLFMETDNIDKLTLRLIFQLQLLRVLSITDRNLVELLKEIGNLTHLRFLDVSRTQLKNFPDEICHLLNLQTLFCGENVERLPNLIGRLKKLRHLIIANKKMEVPQSFEKLTNIRTLPMYGVRKETNNKLGYLKMLNEIRGSITIYFLEALEQEQDIEEAKNAELEKKKITHLVLDFEEKVVSLDLVEALKPPQDLQSLAIKNFISQKLPGWLSCFMSLRDLKLDKCSGLNTLPVDLWSMKLLERLSLIGIPVTRLSSVEFFGIGKILEGGISFPRLSELTLEDFENLTEWEDIGELRQDIEVIPNLQRLSVSAKNLKILPNNLLRKASKLENIQFNGK